MRLVTRECDLSIPAKTHLFTVDFMRIVGTSEEKMLCF